jgi:MFS family permease
MGLSKQDAFRFVWLIGLVSLFSDMTYQGAHGNAGPFLALLGASGTIVGVIAGAGELFNYTLRLVFGYWADKTRAYWWIAFPGYALNLLAVPCLALAGHWPTAAALLILERTGKGIRTPARDVMLSHAADQVGSGWTFGVHEALDQAGGMLGPMLVAATLFCNKGYPASFAILAIPAALAMMLLTATCWLYPHPENTGPESSVLRPASTSTQPMIRTQDPGLRTQDSGLGSRFWLLVAGVGCLAVGYTDFALMAFHFKKHLLLNAGWIPVSYGAAMGLQGLTSLLFGRWFDRWGIKTLIAASVAALGFAPLAFLGSWVAALVGLALWTVGMGAQGSIMKAMVAEIVAPDRRGSAYGLLNATYGVLWFAGSAMMGWLYDRSITGLVIFSVLAQLAALPFLLTLTRQTQRPN